mgnify:CR=1 FL=1
MNSRVASDPARNSPASLQRLESITVLLLVLLTLGLALLWQDIGFYDETIYLAQAAMVTPEWLLSGLEKAPLYAGWYKLLGLACPNPVQLYFLSWGVLAGLILMLPLLFRLPGAWLYAFALACLPIFRIWPYVSLPVAVILLVGLLLVLQRRLSMVMSTAMAVVACILAAYVRSEYVYGIFCAFAAFAVVSLCDWRQADKARRLPLLLVLFGLTVWMAHVQQLSDTGRSGIAFAQHVNLRASERGELVGTNPWTSDHALREFNIDTGHNAANTSASVADFMRANPQRFAHHLWLNLLDLRTLLLTATILLLVLWPWWRGGHAALRPASIYVGLVSLPTLAATLLIYPRLHYAVSILPLLVVLALLLLRPQRLLKLVHAPWLLLAASPVMLAMAVGPRALLSGHWLSERPGLATVSCLRALEQGMAPGSRLMLDALGYPQAYLTGDWRVEPDFSIPNRNALQAWLHVQHPDWVVSVPQQIQRLQLTPESFTTLMTGQGYRAHVCPSPSVVTVYARI